MTRLVFLTCLVAFVTTGCKTTPAVGTVRTVAYAAGVSTALVMNETKLDADKRVVIRDIVREVRKCTPEVGQPIESSWTPIAQQHVDLLVGSGKIDVSTGVLIMAGFKTVMVGVNVIESRYPQIGAGRDLLDAAVGGFCEGFLVKFDTGCANCTFASTSVSIDFGVVDNVCRAAVRNGLK